MPDIPISDALRELRRSLPPELLRQLERIDAIRNTVQGWEGLEGQPSRQQLYEMRREARALEHGVRHLSHSMTGEQRAAAVRYGSLVGRVRRDGTALERLAANAYRQDARQVAVQTARNTWRAFGRAVIGALAAGARAAAASPALLAAAALLAVLIAVGLYFYVQDPSAAAEAEVAQIPFCDCANVDFAFLTDQFQADCRVREAELADLAAGCKGNMSCVSDRLALETGDDRRLAAGEFCNPVAHGPAAWPVAKGGLEPPARGAKAPAPCTDVSGLVRDCR